MESFCSEVLVFCQIYMRNILSGLIKPLCEADCLCVMFPIQKTILRQRTNTSFSSCPNILTLVLANASQLSSHSASETISIQQFQNRIFHCVFQKCCRIFLYEGHYYKRWNISNMETAPLNHDLKIKHGINPPMDNCFLLLAGIQSEGFILPPSLPLSVRITTQKSTFQCAQKSWFRWTRV